MQKVKVSVCGEHLYAEPVRTPLLFVLLHPPSDAMRRRLRTIALDNGYNGHAVTWLCSARVESRRGLLMAKRPWLTATGQDMLWVSIAMAGDIVAAWGKLPQGHTLPPLHDIPMLCMGRTLDGGPICPKVGAKFVRY